LNGWWGGKNKPMDRPYTVKEIDKLRSACEYRWLYGTLAPKQMQFSRQYSETEKTICVEELVRTYMLAGIVGEEIRFEDERG
jgi:hypothetical protein